MPTSDTVAASSGAVVGVDGCRGGWYAVTSVGDSRIAWAVHASFDALIAALPQDAIIGVDIPIGLVERGPRRCDLEARASLGPGRGSSVFPAPVRGVLGAPSHAAASALRALADGKRMSIQAFNIVPKVAEVDAVLRREPCLASRTFEVHPELSFAAMNARRGLAAPKRTRAGRDERLRLLHSWYGDLPAACVGDRPRATAAADDVLDAFAVHWSARRIRAGEARRLPADPERDACGLTMAIHY